MDDAIRRGKIAVKYPSVALLFVPFTAMGGALALFGEEWLPGWVWVTGLIGSFVASWVWWSFTLPRWRVWAVKTTDDLGALVLRAVSDQLMWVPGHFLEKTEIQSAVMRLQLRGALRVALAEYAQSHPGDEPAVRAFVEPWLHPGRSGLVTRSSVFEGWFVVLMFGLFALAMALRVMFAHWLYDRPISLAGTATVSTIGVVLTLLGYRGTEVTVAFTLLLFSALVGLGVSSAVLRAYPWDLVELVSLGLGVIAVTTGFFGLKAMADA